MAGKAKFRIETPRGVITHVHHRNGEVEAKLTWNKGFSRKYKKNFETAQDWIDNEVLKLDEPFVPQDTGALIKSGILHTYIGSGEVKYKTPYARRWYYEPANFSTEKSPEAGNKWFERMKNRHTEHLRSMAERLVKSGK